MFSTTTPLMNQPAGGTKSASPFSTPLSSAPPAAAAATSSMMTFDPLQQHWMEELAANAAALRHERRALTQQTLRRLPSQGTQWIKRRISSGTAGEEVVVSKCCWVPSLPPWCATHLLQQPPPSSASSPVTNTTTTAGGVGGGGGVRPTPLPSASAAAGTTVTSAATAGVVVHPASASPSSASHNVLCALSDGSLCLFNLLNYSKSYLLESNSSNSSSSSSSRAPAQQVIASSSASRISASRYSRGNPTSSSSSLYSSSTTTTTAAAAAAGSSASMDAGAPRHGSNRILALDCALPPVDMLKSYTQQAALRHKHATTTSSSNSQPQPPPPQYPIVMCIVQEDGVFIGEVDVQNRAAHKDFTKSSSLHRVTGLPTLLVSKRATRASPPPTGTRKSHPPLGAAGSAASTAAAANQPKQQQQQQSEASFSAVGQEEEDEGELTVVTSGGSPAEDSPGYSSSGPPSSARASSSSSSAREREIPPSGFYTVAFSEDRERIVVVAPARRPHQAAASGPSSSTSSSFVLPATSRYYCLCVLKRQPQPSTGNPTTTTSSSSSAHTRVQYVVEQPWCRIPYPTAAALEEKEDEPDLDAPPLWRTTGRGIGSGAVASAVPTLLLLQWWSTCEWDRVHHHYPPPSHSYGSSTAITTTSTSTSGHRAGLMGPPPPPSHLPPSIPISGGGPAAAATAAQAHTTSQSTPSRMAEDPQGPNDLLLVWSNGAVQLLSLTGQNHAASPSSSAMRTGVTKPQDSGLRRIAEAHLAPFPVATMSTAAQWITKASAMTFSASSTGAGGPTLPTAATVAATAAVAAGGEATSSTTMTVSSGGLSSRVAADGMGLGGGWLTVVVGDVTLESFSIRLVPCSSAPSPSSLSVDHHHRSGPAAASSAAGLGQKRLREQEEPPLDGASPRSSSSSPAASVSWRWQVTPTSRPFTANEIPITDVQLFQNFSPSLVVMLRSGALLVLDVVSMERQACSTIGRFHRGVSTGTSGDGGIVTSSSDAPLMSVSSSHPNSPAYGRSSSSTTTTMVSRSPGATNTLIPPSYEAAGWGGGGQQHQHPNGGYDRAAPSYEQVGANDNHHRYLPYNNNNNNQHYHHPTTIRRDDGSGNRWGRTGTTTTNRWGADADGLLLHAAASSHTAEASRRDNALFQCLVMGKPFSVCVLDHNAIAIPDRV